MSNICFRNRILSTIIVLDLNTGTDANGRAFILDRQFVRFILLDSSLE